MKGKPQKEKQIKQRSSIAKTSCVSLYGGEQRPKERTKSNEKTKSNKGITILLKKIGIKTEENMRYSEKSASSASHDDEEAGECGGRTRIKDMQREKVTRNSLITTYCFPLPPQEFGLSRSFYNAPSGRLISTLLCSAAALQCARPLILWRLFTFPCGATPDVTLVN